MEKSPLKKARHDLRGRLNALKLCVSAFEILQDRNELLEFIDMTEQAADRTVAALDLLEELMVETADAPQS